MDEVVRRAMAKWPDVPAVFGWLALDLRGQWLIRNEPVTNLLLTDFIGRNYACDDHGRWFFQNGPQRVFVALAYTPWILRVETADTLLTHTGAHVRSVRGAWMDREGIIVLDTEHGAAAIDDRDVEALVGAFTDAAGAMPDEDGLIELLDRTQSGEPCGLRFRHAGAAVPFDPIRRDEVPARLRFVPDPAPLAGEKGVY